MHNAVVANLPHGTAVRPIESIDGYHALVTALCASADVGSSFGEDVKRDYTDATGVDLALGLIRFGTLAITAPSPPPPQPPQAPAATSYCANTVCGGSLAADGYETLLEAGSVQRFGGVATSKLEHLRNAGWSLEPSNYVVSEADAHGITVWRDSPNGGLELSHEFPNVTGSAIEVVVAWGGGTRRNASCTLTIQPDGLVEWSVSAPVSGIEVVTHSTRAGPGRVVLSEEGDGACAVAYILYRGSTRDASHVNLPPSSPPLPPSPIEHNVSSSADLAAALRWAERAPDSTVQLNLAAHTDFDCSGVEWPFDFARVRAPVTIKGGTGTVLDGGGLRQLFHLSTPASDARLIGLELRNFAAQLSPVLDGGAVLVSAGTLSVESCGFTDCSAGHAGGALAVHEGALHVSGSSFDATSASEEGGALVVRGGEVELRESSFRGCSAGNGGAIAVRARDASTTARPRVRSCHFESNSAAQNGGALLTAGKGSSAAVELSNFTNNTATGQGSAIDIESDYATDDRPQLKMNRFEENVGLSTVRYVNFVDWICTAGQYAPRTASLPDSWSGCPLQCPAGTSAANAVDGVPCQSCPPGTVQPLKGQTNCKECARRTHPTEPRHLLHHLSPRFSAGAGRAVTARPARPHQRCATRALIATQPVARRRPTAWRAARATRARRARSSARPVIRGAHHRTASRALAARRASASHCQAKRRVSRAQWAATVERARASQLPAPPGPLLTRAARARAPRARWVSTRRRRVRRRAISATRAAGAARALVR